MLTPHLENGQDYNTRLIWCKLRFHHLLLILFFTLSGCSFPGSTKPVIKIGLIAPFEGELRHHGYQRLYGVKFALQEVNTSGGVAGYKVELVALNDYAEVEESILQARELVIDSDVRGIIGQWDADLHQASMPIYAADSLLVIDPRRDIEFTRLPPNFEIEFQTLSGSLPDDQAKQAYLATHQLLAAIEAAILQSGRPERKEVFQILNSEE